MSSYNLKFNKDDSVFRHVIVSLLADLNKKVTYLNRVDQDTVKKVDIPFFYSLSGDESFMFDHFLLDDLADPESEKAINNYESIPRGVINLTGMSINSASLVNKFVRGNYTKLEENDTMRSYVAQFQMIPVIMNFDAVMVLDNHLSVLRVTEKIIKTFYKNNLFQVDVGTLDEGTYRIASVYKLPDDYEMEKPIEFSFNDKKEYRVNFSLEVESFIPAFEKEDEQYAGNRMFDLDDSIQLENVDPDNPNIGGPDSLYNKTRS